MKRFALACALGLLAGCATHPADRGDQARYGTPPSDEDLYHYLSVLRDTLPPTRYVSYRDAGYAASLKQASAADADGQQVAGWEYDFEASGYDAVDGRPVRWTPYRALFFNGRPIGLIDAQGRLQRVPTSMPAPASTDVAAPPAPAKMP
ncbi:MAG: hypothetical protein REJ50_08500 [Bordetella sp.]|nr:hypothetical protein [Bordetella sp.]